MQPLEKPKPLEIDESTVRNFALRRLSRSAVTEFQLREYLKRKNAPSDLVELVVAKLLSAKLLDDVAFAEMWVRSRRSVRGTGPAVLRRELKLKGVADDVIARAVDEREGDDFEMALSMAVRKAATLQRLEPEAQFRRLLGFLMRRGHSAAISLAATKAALKGDSASEF